MDWIEGARSAAARALQASIETVHAEGIEGTGHLVDAGPIRALSDPVIALADMIVVGAHGHTGVRGLLLGSVAERVLHRSNCSIAVVHERESG